MKIRYYLYKVRIRWELFLGKLLHYNLGSYYRKFIPKVGINITEKREKKIIVSLSSYPKRFATIDLCLKSLLNQTMKPDHIILYLGEDVKENDITPEMRELTQYGVEISMVSGNLKPHKKYYYAIKEFSDDLVITVDDDIIYNRKLVENLWNSYKKYPDCVSACRVHKIIREADNVLPYNQWEYECKRINVPSMDLIATGGAGALYPPNCLSQDATNESLIQELALNADDIWLKYMEVLVSTKVVYVKNNYPLVYVDLHQESALNFENTGNAGNDIVIQKLERFYGVRL